VDCVDLEQGTKQLERIASDAIRWSSDNQVEFEVSKIEVLIFSRSRKVLHITWWYHHWAGTMIWPGFQLHVLKLE
jgi:hypothetical protein